jgi:hypothetical protein
MALKFIFILIILILGPKLYSMDYKYYEVLKEKSCLHQGESLVITYQNIGACDKCIYQAMSEIEYLLKKKEIRKFKIIALIRCEREIELRIFKDKYNWKNYIYLDRGYSRKKLNLRESSNIAIFDFKGNKIVEL